MHRIAPKRRRGALAIAICLLALRISNARGDGLQDAVDRLGGRPCADSSLTCVDIDVPLDHAKPDSNRKLKIHFAVSFAGGESKGILLYAVGGPGGSGTAVADSYLGMFGDDLTKNMDLVFFDQRGTGASNGVDCPKAGMAFDSGPISLDAPEAAVTAAQSFVTACLAETAHRDLLPFLATDQAIQDVEDFRKAVGAPKIWLYGESYGTQFAQQYATRYPEALRGLILDGVVDLTRDAQSFYSEDAVAAEKILANTLNACDAEKACGDDMGASASTVYDRLAATLKAGPVDVDYPLATGRSARRPMTAAILQSDAFNALYGPGARSDFLRALAAGGRGNLIPLLRLGYQNLGADPETLDPAPDPTWYGGAYYAITCPDYDDAGHDPARRVSLILNQAQALAARSPRFTRDIFAERLACAFWPGKGTEIRPKPFAGGAYPTLILNSDSDPATPIANGYGVFAQAGNAYMVTMEGGPHVIWGRGGSCPDRIVEGLLFGGRRPEAREQICKQNLIAPYVPLTLRRETASPLDIAEAIETEIGQSPELSAWDENDAITIGCDFGGSVTAEESQSGTDYTFKDCAWWQGVKVSGEALSISAGDGSAPDGLTLKVDIAGNHYGKLAYRHDSTTDATSLTGDFDGQPIAPRRPMP